MGSVLSSVGSVLSYFCSPSPLPLPSPSPSLLPLPSPSPSLSAPPRETKYEVFLSFRGEDTRNNFTSHLHKAFCDKGIDTFIDNQLRSGDEISPSLLQAIEDSQISVIIFSANYANSRWCLEELVKIIECKENHGQIVIPIFREIDPSYVRNQTGSYAVAFDNHEQRFKKNLDKVQKWRCALKEAADLSGFDSRVVKPESILVRNIVADVLKRLNNMPSCDNKDLVGIDSSIKELETMLGRGTVGIWGFGGIGKTTLAKTLFVKISCQFDASYFVESVREASKRDYELTNLRQKLLSKLLGDENEYFSTFNMKRLHSKKLLIILDDISNFRQVEYLIGDLNYPGCKNRIIVTSKDKQLLKNCCMDNIYELKELCFSDALKLFCRNAFRQNHPYEDYMELSNSVVKMVGGVPLALKVLGSSLLGKTKEVWKSAMEKLEKNFDRNIHEVLKISYEELDDDQRNIFLDIACFFKRWNVDHVKAFMKACGFFPDSGIDSLIDKSLITISHNMLTMHDLLQAMGKEIVRQESINDPGKRSRLWHHKDIYDVLTNEMGTITLEGISLDMSKSVDIYLHPCAFANMQNLRFLNFYNTNCCENRVHVSQGLESISTNLRYLGWYGCPLKSLQSNVLSKNLVELKMIKSKVKELWSGSPQLDNLKIINLWWSQHLTRLPDLSKAPNLESLDLSSCTSLTEIPSSIQHLRKLQSMYLRHCENLMSIPDCNGLKSLKKILLDCCYKVKVAPKLPNNFEELRFRDWTNLCEIPLSYKYFNKLKSLAFTGSKNLNGIPDYSGLKSLTRLTIAGCSKVKVLPEFPNNIEVLELKDIPIEELPSSLENLCRLRHLDLSNCSRLKSLPSRVCKWKSLTKLYLINCSKIDKLPDSLGCLYSLGYLFFNKTNFESIPEGIINLSKLRFLNISFCERLKVLPKLPWARITAVNCTSLEKISCPSFHNDMWALDDGLDIMIANFINCLKLDRNSLNNFVKDTLLELHSQAASTKKRFYHQVYQGFPPPITLRYPGSEIPVWFEYQNKGSFIDVNLPPNWFNYNFPCFALCIVVANPDRQSVHRIFRVRCECSTKSKDGDQPAVINNIIGQESFCQSWVFDCEWYLRSNHVEIGFGFHIFNELYCNQLSFQFYLESTSYSERDKGLNIDYYKVEKCGVHLIYGQHLEILDDKDEEDVPHLEKSDDDDKSHPKRFKHIG